MARFFTREKHRLSALKQTPNYSLMEEKEQQGSSVATKKKKNRRMRTGDIGWYEKKLLQAGFDIPPRLYVAACSGLSLLAGVIVYPVGIILSLFCSLMLAYFLLVGYLEDRATKRKRKVVPQLAPFIDGIASGLSTGFNVEQAIVQAAEGVPPGLLRTELERVVRALNAGFGVREAITVLKDRISGREVTSLAVALNLFATMGGHVLEPFRRLASKIREQQAVLERANRDLVMVKQSFYLIIGISFGVPALMIVIQPQYFAEAFNDIVGRVVIQIGAILILISIMVFRKITRLKL